MVKPMPATIFALSTAPGRAAIAVVRISGDCARDILLALCPPLPEPRRAVLRRLQDPSTNNLLDEALVLYFAAPRTETGEDMAELHLHGGKAVIRAVLETLSKFPGCRMAEPGEFVRRAFANGKLDLAQVEGLADLIDAETESQRRQAMAISAGVQSKRFEHWRDQLLASLALIEAGIDFSDEADVSDQATRQAEGPARSLAADLKSHLADGHRGEILRDGFRVVLAGPPNAGKSSLLNALARRDAAIVSEEPGTTRDIVEVRLDLAGLAVIVQDTAGVRETSSLVEQEGIRRSLRAAREADLVLWLHPAVDAEHRKQVDAEHRNQASAEHRKQANPDVAPPIPGENVLHLVTKTDLLDPATPIHVKHGCAAVSAKTGAGLDDLIRLIATRAREATGDPAAPVITQARHRQEMSDALMHLEAFLEGSSAPVELRAEELRLASLALGRLTGRLDAEDILGTIFTRFCIGK